EPFDFFQGYLAFEFPDSDAAGTQVYGNALLYGWSSEINSNHDNDVFGIVGTFDYQGANNIHFCGMSVGFGYVVEWRFGRKRLRFGTEVDWTYLLGADSPLAPPSEGHNYSTGPSMGVSTLIDLGRAGRIDARSRYYLGAVIDGRGRQEALA